MEVSGEQEWDVYFKLVPKCWSSVLLANFMQIMVDISITHLYCEGDKNNRSDDGD